MPSSIASHRKRKFKLSNAREIAERWGEDDRRGGAEARAKKRAWWSSPAGEAAKARRRIPSRKAVKQLVLYKPVNLNVSAIPKDLFWSVLYLLNLIHMKDAFWRADEAGFVRLKARYLCRAIPRHHWPRVKRWVLGEGVVECDNATIAGVKCNGYRLGEKYRKCSRVVCTDDGLNRKVAALYARDRSHWQPVHHWLESNLERVTIDMARAMRIIARLKPRRQRGEKRMALPEYRQRVTSLCQRIADGEHVLGVGKIGRVSTPLTQLPRELCCCLRVRQDHINQHQHQQQATTCVLPVHGDQESFTGQGLRATEAFPTSQVANYRPIVWIDLKNSQPLFLAMLSRWHATSSTRLHDQLADEGFEGKYALRGLRKVDERVLPEDLRELLRVCQAGTFYESLMTDTELAKGKDYRRKFKVRFYRVLFGRNKLKGRFPNRVRVRFKRLYPTAAGVLWRLKRKNYKHSSHLLQNREATLFIGTICRRIMGERPRLPLYTKHDCLGTTPENVQYVRSVNLDEFAKLGIHPKLSEE